MATIGELVAVMKADISDLEKKLKKGEADTKKTTQKMGEDIKKIPWKHMAIAAAAASAAAIFALQKIAKEAISVAIEQEKVEKRVEAVVKATGMAAGFTADELKGMASALQEVTTVSDETILAGEAILATFKNVRRDAFARTMEAALDMTEVIGTDLNSAMIQLGKAINDPIVGLSALQRVGITFSTQQKETIKDLQEQGRLYEAQALILDELESEFGGAARAAKDTFGGALQSAKNTMGDLLEEIGYTITKNQEFIDMIHEAEEALKDAIHWIKENQEAVQRWGEVIFGTVELGVKFVGVLAKIGKIAMTVARSLQTEVDILDGMNTDTLPASVDNWLKYSYALNEAEIALLKLIEAKTLLAELQQGELDHLAAIAEAEEQTKLDMPGATGLDEALVAGYEATVQMENDVIDARLDARRRYLEESIAMEGEGWEAFSTVTWQQVDEVMKAEEAKVAARKMAGMQGLKDAQFFFAEMGKHSSGAFTVFKGLAIAETVINTIKAAQGAYSALASIPVVGPALGAAAAAAAIMAGMARVSQIRSMQPGSGAGSVSGGAYGVGNAAAPAASTAGAGRLPSIYDREEENRLPTTQIIFQNPVIDNDERTAEIVKKINQLVENNSVELNASTAVEIR